MSEVTAAEAMARANEAHIKVEAHEDLCAERYAHIQTLIANVDNTVGTILKIIGWGGSVLAAILIGLVAFFGSRALQVNDTQVAALRAQVEVNSKALQTAR